MALEPKSPIDKLDLLLYFCFLLQVLLIYYAEIIYCVLNTVTKLTELNSCKYWHIGVLPSFAYAVAHELSEHSRLGLNNYSSPHWWVCFSYFSGRSSSIRSVV
jgi:hypothetical protein